MTWKLRLAVEGGVLEPAVVDTVALPSECSNVTKAVWNGFVFLIACRWLHTPEAPAPFTYPFASAWCGVSTRQAKEARRELKRTGYMVAVGKTGRAILWLPRRPR